ncbi:hypothetical protein K502DRAFT_343965 [Neoconidiobolus thromboides FSU 785]|nr:hypothetical protein K502DRAFT_343965 [Neoconidiobolus thromboides FSU 785]
MSSLFFSKRNTKKSTLRGNSGDSLGSVTSDNSNDDSFTSFLWNYAGSTNKSDIVIEHNCCLFPSYGVKVGSGRDSYWNIKIKGRAFNRPKPTRSHKLALALARKVVGITKEDVENRSLEERFGFFLDANSINLTMNIDVLGLTCTNTMEISTEPIFTEEPEDDILAFESKTLPKKVRERESDKSNKLEPGSFTNTCDMISNNIISGNRKLKTHPVEVKDGHFNTDIQVPDEIIQTWKSNISKDQPDNILVVQAKHSKTSPGVTGQIQLLDEYGISIISDIDDTIKDSGVYLGKKVVLSNTFLYDCKDVTGMSDVYKYWWIQGAAFHYVSNSPWQLLPMLEDFFRKHSFPSGSAHLKLFDIRSHKSFFYEPQGSKKASILQLFQDFPNRKFILIGDSGEMDLELYTSLAREHPESIVKIFIRDITTPLLKKKSSLSNLAKNNGSSSSLSKLKSSVSGLRGVTKARGSVSSLKDAVHWLSGRQDKYPTVTQSPNCSRTSLSSDAGLETKVNSSLSSSIDTNTLHPIQPLRSDSTNSFSSTDSGNSLQNEDMSNSINGMPNNNHIKLRMKFQHRVNQATKGLTPNLVTLFESPNQLLECPIVKQALTKCNSSLKH